MIVEDEVLPVIPHDDPPIILDVEQLLFIYELLVDIKPDVVLTPVIDAPTDDIIFELFAPLDIVEFSEYIVPHLVQLVILEPVQPIIEQLVDPDIIDCSDDNILDKTVPVNPDSSELYIPEYVESSAPTNLDEHKIEFDPPVIPPPVVPIIILDNELDTHDDDVIILPILFIVESRVLINDDPSTILPIVGLVDAAIKLFDVFTLTVPIFANDTGPSITSNTLFVLD